MQVDFRRRLDDGVRRTVEALAARAEQADEVKPLSEQSLLQLRTGGPDESDVATAIGHLLAYADPGDTLIGYARLDPAGDPAAAELVVDPDRRRRGVGSALLAELERRAPGAAVWAHGFTDAARSFAAARGLTVVRELWQMRLDDPSGRHFTVDLPDGFTVTAFTEADIDAWVRLNARAFAAHPEQGRITATDVRERMRLPWFDPDGFLLIRVTGDATNPGANPGADPGTDPPVAFHWTKIEDGSGEVYVVGIDPAYQGRGLAGPVTGLGLRYLAGRGVRAITLYVDGDNEPAIATYRSAGFERTALDVMLARGGSPTG